MKRILLMVTLLSVGTSFSSKTKVVSTAAGTELKKIGAATCLKLKQVGAGVTAGGTVIFGAATVASCAACGSMPDLKTVVESGMGKLFLSNLIIASGLYLGSQWCIKSLKKEENQKVAKNCQRVGTYIAALMVFEGLAMAYAMSDARPKGPIVYI